MKRPLFLSYLFAGYEPLPNASREESRPADAPDLQPSRDGAGVVRVMGSRLSYLPYRDRRGARAGHFHAKRYPERAGGFIARIARSISVGTAALMWLITCDVSAGESNPFSDAEKQSGWRLLF